MARARSSTDGLNAVASSKDVLCLKFMAQAAKWMLIWYFFYREATVIHRVITSQPVHTRGYQEVGEGNLIVSLTESCQTPPILHNSRLETLSVITVENPEASVELSGLHCLKDILNVEKNFGGRILEPPTLNFRFK